MIGLAVMGSNLARNIERGGLATAVYNREQKTTDEFLQKFTGNFTGSNSLQDFVSKMASPRQIFMMIKAGAPVDSVIQSLLPLLSPGDIIIDGGNSYFKDTQRREALCKEKGINFMGIGISGGEEGALNGASLMPGGPKAAWQIVAPVLDKVAAKVDGKSCTAYVGPDGAGHFVKMVHNGIEYGDMQLIAEAYDVLRQVVGSQPEELAGIFESWNEGPLNSYLIEITSKVFRQKDPSGKGYLVDVVLDKAGQKGTGMWTAQIALDLGVAIPSLAAAVDARILSSIKDQRKLAEKAFAAPANSPFSGDKKAFVQKVHDALYCSKIIAYAQGMDLIGRASKDYNWNLNLGEISSLWKGGCIIRARFLDQIRKAYEQNKSLANLIMDPFMKQEVTRTVGALREVTGVCVQRGIPAIAFGTSLAYFDSYRTAEMPQNLTQAQRDFFGSHTYERKDKPGVFHFDWIGGKGEAATEGSGH
jgi:6-phosphogluconate dehydrogenase